VLIFEPVRVIAPLLPPCRSPRSCSPQTVIGPSATAPFLATTMTSTPAAFHRGPTTDREKTITNLKTGTSGGGCTMRYSTAVGLLRDQTALRRRVIIVVSEARDSGSEEKLGGVLREAQLSNIVMYGVGLSTTAASCARGPSRRDPSRPRRPACSGDAHARHGADRHHEQQRDGQH